tara:strand:- start:5530 stop:6072 length:543 start_codon:yes stop_codon:yes gene_type:complete
MKIKQYPINQLIYAEYNPRQLTKKQYQNLKDSIKRFGLVDPVLVNINKDRKDIIIGGHQRVTVAKDLGIRKVPCVELDLTLEKEKELNVRLNQNTGEWDFDTLADNFDIDELISYGFEESDLELYDEPIGDDLVGEDYNKPIELKVKLKNEDHVDNCLEDIQKVLEKYEGATVSVSGGQV